MSENITKCYADILNAQHDVCGEQHMRDGIDEMSHIYSAYLMTLGSAKKESEGPSKKHVV